MGDKFERKAGKSLGGAVSLVVVHNLGAEWTLQLELDCPQYMMASLVFYTTVDPANVK